MSIYNDIRACLDNHLAGTSDIPVVRPDNTFFEPTVGVPFIKSTFIPVTRRPATRGINPVNRYDGVYSLLVCTPQGSGSGLGYSIADTLLARFQEVKDITYYNPTDTILLESGDTLALETGDSLLLGSPTIVSLDYAEVGLSYLESPFYCTPVNVAWYIFK